MKNNLFPFHYGDIEGRIGSAIRQSNVRPDRLVSMPVKGDDLTKHGIRDGDIIVVNLDAQIKPLSFVIGDILGRRFVSFLMEMTAEKCVFDDAKVWTANRSEVAFHGAIIKMERDL